MSGATGLDRSDNKTNGGTTNNRRKTRMLSNDMSPNAQTKERKFSFWIYGPDRKDAKRNAEPRKTERFTNKVADIKTLYKPNLISKLNGITLFLCLQRMTSSLRPKRRFKRSMSIITTNGETMICSLVYSLSWG